MWCERWRGCACSSCCQGLDLPCYVADDCVSCSFLHPTEYTKLCPPPPTRSPSMMAGLLTPQNTSATALKGGWTRLRLLWKHRKRDTCSSLSEACNRAHSRRNSTWKPLQASRCVVASRLSATVQQRAHLRLYATLCLTSVPLVCFALLCFVCLWTRVSLFWKRSDRCGRMCAEVKLGQLDPSRVVLLGGPSAVDSAGEHQQRWRRAA